MRNVNLLPPPLHYAEASFRSSPLKGDSAFELFYIASIVHYSLYRTHVTISQQMKRIKQIGASLRPRLSALPSARMSHAECTENAEHTSLALVCAVRMASTSAASAPLCSLRPLCEEKSAETISSICEIS